MEPQPEPTGSTLKQLVTVPSACTSGLTDQDGQRTCPICFTDDLVVPQMDTEEEDTEDEVLEEDLSVISAELYLARPVVINSGEESWERQADEKEEEDWNRDLEKSVVHLGPQVR